MRSVVLAFLLVVPSVALARPVTPPPLPAGTTWRPLCPDHTCKARIAIGPDGTPVHSSAPSGYGAPDLQEMFDIDPSRGAGMTVAVVDAYGYTEIESDLAMYRSTYNLPPCTVASGCLTILNSNGQTSPLDSDTDQSWIVESALDVQMISAACPQCKIVAVQAEGAGTMGLEVGQLVAAKLFVDTISDSWGGPEDSTDEDQEGDFNNAGIATFVSSGDDAFAGGASYPATSAFAISVGGIGFDTTSGTNIAWSYSQSGCSAYIPLQPWSPAAQGSCARRAAADIAAYASGTPGVAVYVGNQGGWMPVSGTSAASPFAAALFAAAGHGDARPAFVYKHPDAFVDVTSGSTGTCGSNLCNAVVGWDGPTGLGTPDQGKLAAIGGVLGAGPTIQVTYPADGATVPPGFTIQVTPDDATQWTEIDIDGTRFTKLGTPWMTQAPESISDGPHTLTFISYDLDHNSQMTSIGVTVGTPDTMAPPGGSCSAGGTPGAGTLIVLFGALIGPLRRRRRV